LFVMKSLHFIFSNLLRHLFSKLYLTTNANKKLVLVGDDDDSSDECCCTSLVCAGVTVESNSGIESSAARRCLRAIWATLEMYCTKMADPVSLVVA
jgi:hypothetical protein